MPFSHDSQHQLKGEQGGVDIPGRYTSRVFKSSGLRLTHGLRHLCHVVVLMLSQARTAGADRTLPTCLTLHLNGQKQSSQQYSTTQTLPIPPCSRSPDHDRERLLVVRLIELLFLSRLHPALNPEPKASGCCNLEVTFGLVRFVGS